LEAALRRIVVGEQERVIPGPYDRWEEKEEVVVRDIDRDRLGCRTVL
jgi:hypothetical protein